MACVRAALDRNGIIDDPYARMLLTVEMRAVLRALSLPGLHRLTSTPFFAALATRVAFFDREVQRALDHGIGQIVVLGAGYDTRAWRFERPGATFIEVDHPDTQQAKRQRAAACPTQPSYVAADLRDPLAPRLEPPAFDSARPALFVIEGVTMYLDEAEVAGLLTQVRDLAGPGSRLAVNFAAPRARRSAPRWLARAGGEPQRLFTTVTQAAQLVRGAGWQEVHGDSLRDVAGDVLGEAAGPLPIERISGDAAVVTATSAVTFGKGGNCHTP